MRVPILVLALSAAISPAEASPVIDAPAGLLRGTTEGRALVFRGVPYAEPPIGDLRWRAPQPARSWQGVRGADRFGNICMQPANPSDAGVGREPASEDCLTLNIWAPADPAARRHAPVMVWLHGGGYTSGSGSAPLYDGRRYAEAGVVLVTLNYRLGRLGYFAHPELGRRTNFGLLDQLAALRWVRRNIAAFGGDPRNVTLFGNSAGGESVLLLMLAPKARALFARAIVQSGLGGRQLPGLAEATAEGRRIAALLGATSISGLRSVPAERILAVEAPSIYRGFGPAVDARTVGGSIADGFAAGRQARVPLVIGYNGREVPPAAIGGVAAAVRLVGHTPPERARWEAAYGSTEKYENEVASDALFRGPAVNLALLHAKTKAPTYLYEFDRAPDTVRTRLGGAPHASERAYVFGNLANAPWPAGAEDQSLAEEMGLRWRAFARAGEPSIPGGAPWPRVGAKPRALRFDHGTVAAFEPPPTGLLRLFHTDGAAEHSRRRR